VPNVVALGKVLVFQTLIPYILLGPIRCRARATKIEPILLPHVTCGTLKILLTLAARAIINQNFSLTKLIVY
jgi:hypothetical protein